MSVTIRHLNADSTFLLIFSPSTNPAPSDLRAANGAYSVLIDPWITGPSIVNAKWFAVTDRIEPSAINHMTDIEEPDVVVVSQNKPDHCHKETLLQLMPEGKTVVAAEPGAAKAIRSWNHFDPNRVYGLDKYDAKARFGNTLRLRIPPMGPEGLPGELTVAFIPAKNYMTGLHNAFGITYQAPTKTKALASFSSFDLSQLKEWPLLPQPQTVPLKSPALIDDRIIADLNVALEYSKSGMFILPKSRRGHRPQLSRSSNTASSELLSFDAPSIRPSCENIRGSQHSRSQSQSEHIVMPKFDFGNGAAEFLQALPMPPTPPLSPESLPTRTHQSQSQHHRNPSNTSAHSILSPKGSTSTFSTTSLATTSTPTLTPAKPKCLSILYTPHGIPLPDLQPYIQTHLVPRPGCLPLTALLHSFSHAQNPWYLGGNILAGAPNGVNIARALMARCWISAHDEEKADSGVAVKLLRTRHVAAEEVRRYIAAEEGMGSKKWACDVRSLPVGREVSISSETRVDREVKQGACPDVGLGLELGLAQLRSDGG